MAALANWWALRFTPRVALADDNTLLLEVSACERLWGGREALQAQILQAWGQAASLVAVPPAAVQARGEGAIGAGTEQEASLPAPLWGSGPTALVAQARLRMARNGRPWASGDIHQLPLHTLTALRPHESILKRMGCCTWGALRALPRDGVVRRLGAGVLYVLDQAFGEAPEVHHWLELPEQFALTADLPAPAESSPALLWGASRCLTALQGWLQARQQGVLALEFSWRHDLRRIDGVQLPPTQALQVRTAQPTHDMVHVRRLLAENLARIPLAAPASQITLRLLEAAALPHATLSLLTGVEGRAHLGATDAQGETLHQLLERLSARLGPGKVQASELRADHRPEHMQQWLPAAQVLGQPGLAPADLQGAHCPDATLWPTWLLRPPRRLAVQGNRPFHHGLLRLLAGPHRFEAGWWPAVQEAAHPAADGTGRDSHGPDAPVALRDYFVACNDAVGLVWVFRERLPPQAGTNFQRMEQVASAQQRWFLHGIFG